MDLGGVESSIVSSSSSSSSLLLGVLGFDPVLAVLGLDLDLALSLDIICSSSSSSSSTSMYTARFLPFRAETAADRASCCWGWG